MPGAERSAGVVALVGVTALAAAALGWAGAVVFAPAPSVPEEEFALATVERGEVSSALELTVAATWPTAASAVNQATGTVTAIVARPGESVSSGAVLFDVDLRPVVLVRGAVPAFRPLTTGVAGEDIAQLQQFLIEAGLLSGSADGEFGTATAAAVADWQESLGLEPEGIVRLGDIVFSPQLPARVDLDPEVVSVGRQLGGGETVLRVLATEPDFSVAVSAEQSAELADGAGVEITGPGGEQWRAVLGERAVDEEGAVVIALEGESGGVCGDGCGSIPVGQPVELAARIVLVEPVRGLVVPTGALVTRPGGEVIVLEEDGTAYPVDVLASARGLSVVTGVEEGLSVRIPGETAQREEE